MHFLSYFIWNADPELFAIGTFSLRYYGLLFALGFVISQQILYFMHKKEGKPVKDVDTLTVWMVIGTIVGARLGHVLFYEPAKYFADPIEIFMIRKGGLASHGAVIGILLVLWIYSKYEVKFKGLKFQKKKIDRENQSYLQVLDRLVILIAMTAALIRIGNFINSEIEGKPTGGENGIFFARNVTDRLVYPNSAISSVGFAKGDGEATAEGYQPLRVIATFRPGYEETELRSYIQSTFHNNLINDRYISKYLYEPSDRPIEFQLVKDGGSWNAIVETYAITRYPSQLFEASGYLIVFIILYLIWNRKKLELPAGRTFGLFLILLWGLRIAFEFLKANQVDFENNLPLNMGQLLSIPLVLAGVYFLIRSYKKA